MYLRLQYTVKGLPPLKLKQDESLQFPYGGKHHVTVRLQNSEPHDKTSPDKLALIGEAETAKEFDADTLQVLNKPETFKEQLIASAEEVGLAGYLSRTINVFRWRQGFWYGPVNPFSDPIHEFSFDRKQWRNVPRQRSLKLIFGVPYATDPSHAELCSDVVDLVIRKVEEPLGHQMYPEAWGLRWVSPRAALVIGFAAGEVGFKQFLKGKGQSISERSVWYEQIKTRLTPLGRISVPGGKNVSFPKLLLKKLAVAANLRKRVVHEVFPAPSESEVDSALNAVNDLLWILDMFAGFMWAGKHISHDTVKYLGS